MQRFSSGGVAYLRKLLYSKYRFWTTDSFLTKTWLCGSSRELHHLVYVNNDCHYLVYCCDNFHCQFNDLHCFNHNYLVKAYIRNPDVAFAINVLREKTFISKSPSAHHYVWNSIASDQNFHNDHVLLYLRKRVQVIWQICLQGHGACRRGPFQSWRWPSPCLHPGWGLCQPMGGQ